MHDEKISVLKISDSFHGNIRGEVNCFPQNFRKSVEQSSVTCEQLLL